MNIHILCVFLYSLVNIIRFDEYNHMIFNILYLHFEYNIFTYSHTDKANIEQREVQELLLGLRVVEYF